MYASCIVYHTRFYVGHTPVLVVGNPEMVKEITIKQAANFMDRSVCLHLVFNYNHFIHSSLICIEALELASLAI